MTKRSPKFTVACTLCYSWHKDVATSKAASFEAGCHQKAYGHDVIIVAAQVAA